SCSCAPTPSSAAFITPPRRSLYGPGPKFRAESAQLSGDPLQHPHESLPLPRADDAIEVAFVCARASRELRKQLPSRRRKRQPVGALVVARALAADQAAANQIIEHGREARLVAAVGAAERGLADAGVAADQHQRGEPPRPAADLVGEPQKRLE